MKFKLLLMAAACIGMVACSKDDAANPSADGSKQIVLKVNLPTTRAAQLLRRMIRTKRMIQLLDR